MKRIDLTLRPPRGRPICVGAGFVALDIVESSIEPFAAAGGSCGNVMAILAWLGWSAQPVARLGEDWAGKLVTQDLRRSGVDTNSLFTEPKVKTPIVIERFVEKPPGQRSHRFSLTCPGCGAWLPRHRPLTTAQAGSVTEKVRAPKAYYFDRVSPASIKLARWAKDAGAIVVFEPSSIGDEHHFQRAVDLCHVLKFSHDRLGHVPDLAEAALPRIVVETFGADGLRVRWRARWSHLPAFEAPSLRDAAGSGDWCTAGLIHVLAQQGAKALGSLRKQELDIALRFGQGLAAVNCGFDGARGAMLGLSRKQMSETLMRLKEPSFSIEGAEAGDIPLKVPVDICGLCSDGEGKGCKNPTKREVA